MQDTPQTDEAERLIKRAVDIGLQLTAQATCEPWVQGDLAANLHNLGILLADRGERSDAIRNSLLAATLLDQQLEFLGNEAQLIGGACAFVARHLRDAL
jgi:hypothetical protein